MKWLLILHHSQYLSVAVYILQSCFPQIVHFNKPTCAEEDKYKKATYLWRQCMPPQQGQAGKSPIELAQTTTQCCWTVIQTWNVSWKKRWFSKLAGRPGWDGTTHTRAHTLDDSMHFSSSNLECFLSSCPLRNVILFLFFRWSWMS